MVLSFETEPTKNISERVRVSGCGGLLLGVL
jgi:hypothetical protein